MTEKYTMTSRCSRGQVVSSEALRSVSTTRVHGPSSRAELTARELGCIF